MSYALCSVFHITQSHRLDSLTNKHVTIECWKIVEMLFEALLEAVGVDICFYYRWWLLINVCSRKIIQLNGFTKIKLKSRLLVLLLAIFLFSFFSHTHTLFFAFIPLFLFVISFRDFGTWKIDWWASMNGTHAHIVPKSKLKWNEEKKMVDLTTICCWLCRFLQHIIKNSNRQCRFLTEGSDYMDEEP